MKFNKILNLKTKFLHECGWKERTKRSVCLILKMTRFVVEICGSATVQNEHSSPILNKWSLTNANAMMVQDVLPAVHIYALQSLIFLHAFLIHFRDQWKESFENVISVTLPFTKDNYSSFIKLKLIAIDISPI